MIAEFPDLHLTELPFDSASAIGRLLISLLLGCSPRGQLFRVAAGALLDCHLTANAALVDVKFAHVQLPN